MPIQLPEVDVDAIGSLDEAKQVIRVLLHSFEQLFVLYEKQQEKIILLEKEIAHLKKQPKKPQFPNQKQASFSATATEKGKTWQKSKRSKVGIDQDVQLPEVDTCVCGSPEFMTISTTTKVVQGLVINRNNTAYHGRRKKCRSCGKIYTPHPQVCNFKI